MISLVEIKDQFDNIKTLFYYFFDNKFLFLILFVLAIQYLWFKEENKRIRNFFTIFIIIILLVIWNPICTKLLGKYINFSSMYRVYFMLPMHITIAVALVKLITNIKNDKIKLFSVLGCCVFIALAGDCIFNEYSTILTNNSYKVLDESVEIAEIIEKDTKYSEKRAMVPYEYSSQIQQVYGDIFLPYTRIVYNPQTADGKESPADSDDVSNYEPVIALNSGDVNYLEKYTRKHNLNYIVINNNVQLQGSMEDIGYEVIGVTNDNIIYRKVDFESR